MLFSYVLHCPLTQGCTLHGVVSNSQFLPLNPGLQSHLWMVKVRTPSIAAFCQVQKRFVKKCNPQYRNFKNTLIFKIPRLKEYCQFLQVPGAAVLGFILLNGSVSVSQLYTSSMEFMYTTSFMFYKVIV